MAEELRAYKPTLGERMKGGMQDLLMGLGADPYTGGRIAGSIKDLLGFTPVGIPMAVSDMGHAMDQGDPLGVGIAALGALPGGPAARGAGKAISKTAGKMLDPTEEAIKAIEEALGTPNYNMSSLTNAPGPKAAPSQLPDMMVGPGSDFNKQADDLYAQAFKNAGAKPAPNAVFDPATSVPEDLYIKTLPDGKFAVADAHGILDGGFSTKEAATQAAIDNKSFYLGIPPPVDVAPAAPKKIAPIDSGVDMYVWLDKNPGASINDFLGMPTPVAKPLKINTAPSQTDLPDVQLGNYVPPRPDAAEVPNPAPTQHVPWTIHDTDEAIRQSNREAMGYTTQAFHGTQHTFEKRPDGSMPVGGSGYLYSSANPVLGETYASELMRNPDKGYNASPGAQIMPLWLDTSKYHKFDAGGQMWNAETANKKAIAEARAVGAPGVQVDNVWDEYGSTKVLPSPQTIFITLDPAAGTVRSKSAKFDPNKKGINDILAGLGGIGLGTGAMIGGQRDGQ